MATAAQQQTYRGVHFVGPERRLKHCHLRAVREAPHVFVGNAKPALNSCFFCRYLPGHVVEGGGESISGGGRIVAQQYIVLAVSFFASAGFSLPPSSNSLEIKPRYLAFNGGREQFVWVHAL